MSIPLTVLIGTLFTVGAYLIMQRTISRIVIGVGVLSNGANLLIVATSARPGQPGAPPIIRDGQVSADRYVDPVPQALVLTGIVIGLAVTAFLLALAWRNWTLDGNDEVEDDLSDRKLRRGDR